MRKTLIALVIVAGAAGAFAYYRSNGASGGAPATPGARGGFGGGPGGFGGGGAGARPPMTVELAAADRAPVTDHLLVVGNLVGAATVEVASKVNGRLESVAVRIGDRVSRGSRIAKVEDSEIREQVKQAEASFEVSQATIRQREADLKFAETNLERARSLFFRQLLPQQSLDDAEARYQAASAQLDLARAQFNQAKSRLDELRINLANTLILSPVDGFVGKRYLDPGAFVSSNTAVASVVDIQTVRLITNLVERDLRRVAVGSQATVEVDAFPGETFTGRVARVAPVLDPSTRTAQMEVEVPNPGARLKPGMYARVNLTVDHRSNALVVPRNSLVDIEGKRGVFVAEDQTVRFVPVEIGLQDANRVEIVRGLDDGQRVVTTGAAGLRDGDRILLSGQGGPGGPGGQGGPGAGAPGRGGRPRQGGPSAESDGGRTPRGPGMQGSGGPGAPDGAGDGGPAAPGPRRREGGAQRAPSADAGAPDVEANPAPENAAGRPPRAAGS